MAVKSTGLWVYYLGLSLVLLAGCPNPASLVQFGLMTEGQIASGFQYGIASQPYIVYSDTSLEKINEICEISPGIRVSIEDTYKSAYGKNLEEALPSGDTGQVFRNMKEATAYLQKILKDKGLNNSEDYVVTSIDSARSQGFVLFALVKRPGPIISVADRQNAQSGRQLGMPDRDYYLPYMTDAGGNALDTVIDWAGLPNECFATQKAQAIFLTLAANQVLSGRTRSDFWKAQQQWVRGDFKGVMKQQDEETCVFCGFEEGFFKG